MGDFEIIRRNGTKTPLFSQEPFCAVKSATQNCTLMGDDNVQLSIVSSVIMSFDKGDKIIINGEEYSIRTLPTRQMQSDTYYTYDVTFYGVMYELMKTIYRNTDADGKSTSSSFDLTYSIRDFVKVLIYNVERDYPGLWNFDEVNCPETEPITITFSNNNCLQVLQTLCSDDNFKLEFRITQENGVRTIHIGKFGAKVVPPGGGDYFEWGRGNGLYTLTEKKVDDKAIITRLWVEGGTTNIRSDYRNYSERLQLPYPKRMNEHEHTLSDGTVIAANSEMIGIDDDNKRYIEDAQLRDKYGSDEDAAQYDKIYPKRTGKVTALVGDDVNSFIDDTMDFDLNEKDENGTKWLIAETTAKINFITGRLAGQQFELAAKNGYDHTTKKFTIIPFTDERGLTIPTADNEAYRINVGDQYNITDIHLPKAYEDDAEEDLWYAGYDDFKPRTQPQAQYELTLDRAYFIDALPDDSETCVFHVGDYVPIRDTRFGIEKNIRIQKVSRNLLTEQDYSLTLADTVAVSVYTQTVLDVIDHDIIIENNGLRDLNKARRGWRTTEELRNMVYDTDGYFDTDNIRPNSIDTNMLTVGSKSQQFILGGVVFQPNYNGDPNNFVATSGVLAHLTIDENNIRQWSIGASQTTLVSSAGYYLFAKCSRDGQSGVWYITQEQMKFEDESDPNNYYFLVGILSSVYADENFRDFTATYGFTRINGRTITTGRVQSSTKESYFDLDSDTFKLGDALSFNLNGNKVLRLKGALVQSESGDEDYIGCYRGVYNPRYTYFKGDEVSYESNGNTSTYRMINNNPCVGVAPTNTVYWQVLAQGSKGDKGDDGKYTELRYAKNGSTTTPPILNKASLVPAGWSTTMPSVGTLEYLWMTSAVKSADGNTLVQQWATPVRVSPYDGKDGKSPALVYRGEYDSSKTYYGNEFRLDCVKYGDMHYVARIDAGTFYGVIPTNTSKWNQFGAQFESVATQLLLAELANIGNFIIKNNCIISQKGTINGVESTDYSNPNFVPNIMLDGQNGQSVLCGSQRSPFVRFDGSWYVGSDFSSLAECYDNLVFPISETGGWENNINFPWSTKCNGRKITLVNYKWGNETPSGKFEIEAPTGKYFYEDGIQKDKLQFSREVIELLGYGDNTTFFGWIVVGRHDIATTSKYGRTFKVLAMGEVTGTKSSASIKYHTFDGSTLSVERSGTGIYKITHSSQWFASVDDRMVILSGKGYVAGGDSPVKATYISSGATAISVHTSDDESRNDGSFQFLIANLSNWSYD